MIQPILLLRFILCLSPINRNKANLKAQFARHAKLETNNTPGIVALVTTGKSVSAWLFGGLHRLMGLDSESSPMARLTRKMVAISMVFFIFSSFGPLYTLTEGQGSNDELSFVDYTEEDTGGILENIMTEDGFILKPALNSTAGDRRTSNEIFAYEVEPGDTLSSLAQRFGIKKETVVMENDLWNVNRLKSGMTLKILPVDGISHVVEKGETIEKIAKKYKVDIKQIMVQNQLEEGQNLLASTALIIPGAKKEIQVPVIAYSGKGRSSAPSNPAAFNYTGETGGRLIWPTLSAGKLTQGFHRGHYALDIANRAKGPIFAAASGKVIKADYGWNGGYGNYIIIDHGDGMQTLYAHNEKLYVSAGQQVNQGETIAWMGNSGRVHGPTGIHVHFEVRIKGVKYDARKFF